MLASGPASSVCSVTLIPKATNCFCICEKENEYSAPRRYCESRNGIGGDRFRTGIAAVDCFPQSDDPCSIEFVGENNL